MTTSDNKKLVKNNSNYYCNICDYNTSVKYNYSLHCNTIKHINNIMTTNVKEKLGENSSNYYCKYC